MHDIGKMFTQSFDEKNTTHYYGHHNVGSYFLASHPEILYYKNITDFKDILFYVNYHMNVFFWKEEKTKNKYKNIFGEEKYNNLLIFNKFDKIASGSYERNDLFEFK